MRGGPTSRACHPTPTRSWRRSNTGYLWLHGGLRSRRDRRSIAPVAATAPARTVFGFNPAAVAGRRRRCPGDALAAGSRGRDGEAALRVDDPLRRLRRASALARRSCTAGCGIQRTSRSLNLAREMIAWLRVARHREGVTAEQTAIVTSADGSRAFDPGLRALLFAKKR